MPATRQTTATTDRLSDAILERQAGIFDVIRSATDRNHRFTRRLIASARQVSTLPNLPDLGLTAVRLSVAVCQPTRVTNAGGSTAGHPTPTATALLSTRFRCIKILDFRY